jgi:hypothetical protein
MIIAAEISEKGGDSRKCYGRQGDDSSTRDIGEKWCL